MPGDEAALWAHVMAPGGEIDISVETSGRLRCLLGSRLGPVLTLAGGIAV